jgi:hypothetical protein
VAEILLIGNQEAAQMPQPQLARITCSVCNGWYVSDSALRDHMQTAHRRFVSEESTFQRGTAYPDGFRNQIGTSNEGWAKLSAELRNLLQARFTQEELDTIDRFILLASQGSVFDRLCR